MGFEAIDEQIKEEMKKNPSIKDIVIIIAGNDIQFGKKYCQIWLNEVMKHRPTIYSVIPNYSRNDRYYKDLEDEQEEMKLAETKTEEIKTNEMESKEEEK